jgi:hypothetical protein
LRTTLEAEGNSRSHILRLIMKPREILTEDILRLRYVELCKSCKTIAKELGVKSHTSVRQALQKFNIAIRPSEFNEKARTNSRQIRWKGYGEISGKYLYMLKYRNREYNVSGEYLWKLFLEQDRKCALSGIHLIFAKFATPKGMLEQTASLDRIDSSKGYIVGNVQWIHKSLNGMKSDMSDDEFIAWCCLVAKHRGNDI